LRAVRPGLWKTGKKFRAQRLAFGKPSQPALATHRMLAVIGTEQVTLADHADDTS
jgi:hypothetical protein